MEQTPDQLERLNASVSAYRRRLEDQVLSLRNLRSWQLMLFANKTYSMLAREGWKGRMDWLKWIAMAPVRGLPGLASFEPQFPEILDFLPASLAQAPPFNIDTLPNAVRYDVIILPVFDFEFRYQRPQHIARQFALSGHRVFWLSPSRRSLDQPYSIRPLSENLWEINVACPLPDIYRGELQPSDVDAIMEGLGPLFRQCGLVANCALLQLPFWCPLGLRLREEWGSRVVYDCMDHWQSFPGVSESLRQQESRLSSEADVLTVTARQLFDVQTSRGLHPELIRNAADYEFFSAGHSQAFLSHIPRPIVGYYGAIAEWFDFDLVRALAEARPQYSFVLIGGLGLERNVTGEQVEKLKKISNVHLIGHEPYARLPAYLADFDACMIPFLRNSVTDATDPVKLYEYLSQGKPVVSADLTEVREHVPHVSLATGVDNFAAALDGSLAEDGSQRTARQKYARENSWPHRKEQFHNAIQASFPLVSIVIVTYNSAPFLPVCLASLARHATYPQVEIVCVDNASTDDSAAILSHHAAIDSRIEVISSTTNLGFAAGNNLAVRRCRGAWIVFLNPDTVVTSGWIERLLWHFRTGRKIGLVNPVTNSAGNEVMIPTSYGNLRELDRFAASVSESQSGRTYELDVCPLFCAMTSAEIWQELGELDERFNQGMFEDDDYSRRVKKAGLRIVAAEDCFVHHFGGGSFGALPTQEYQSIFDTNRAYFEEKWKSPWTPHRYRPGITAPNKKYFPEQFFSN